MSNKLNILKLELQKLGKSLSTVFAELPAEAPKGNELKVSAVEVGGKVELVNADGSLAPAPDGDYDFNGDTLSVKDGLIEAINGDKGEPVQMAAPAPDPDQSTDDADNKADADLEARLQALEDAIAEIKSALQADKEADANEAAQMAAQFAEQVKELNETIKTLASIPVEFSKTSNDNKVNDAKEEKMNTMLNIYSRRK